MKAVATNPILPGFYPDPSIVRAGDDYYILNSSFAYFPGLPIMHSKDLANWHQIGNVLCDDESLPLDGTRLSQGLFAPTIRYHEGRFYVVCTNISRGGNFIVTADNINGPWSKPVYIKGADGIDPSIFFDDDGKIYYIGTHPNPEGEKYGGDYYIYIGELDKETFQFTGEKVNVWNGSMRNIIWPEGPHLYKKDDYYYIMHAEGGTGPNHCEAICRSKSLFGPYENNMNNPIITHRDMGSQYPIQYVGHADLVETPEGEWFMVMLGVRRTEGFTTIGRETFIAKVIWEDGWPVVNPGVAKLTQTVDTGLEEAAWDDDVKADRNYQFSSMEKIGPEFLTLRNEQEGRYVLSSKGLEIKASKLSVTEESNPSYLGMRVQNHAFKASATAIHEAADKDVTKGLVMMQNEGFSLRVEAAGDTVSAILRQNEKDEVIGSVNIADEAANNEGCSQVSFVIRADGLKAQPGVIIGNKELLFDEADIRALSTEIAGGFVGCTIGMYASDNSGKDLENSAVFTNFKYEA